VPRAILAGLKIVQAQNAIELTFYVVTVKNSLQLSRNTQCRPSSPQIRIAEFFGLRILRHGLRPAGSGAHAPSRITRLRYLWEITGLSKGLSRAETDSVPKTKSQLGSGCTRAHFRTPSFLSRCLHWCNWQEGWGLKAGLFRGLEGG